MGKPDPDPGPDQNRTMPLMPQTQPHRYSSSVHTLVALAQIRTVYIYGQPIISLFVENQERLCLAQISSTLLKDFSYNEIHNRRVALGITCIQCTPVQLEILRRAGAMPASSRRCGMITRREAERLCKSFFGECTQPALPEGFAFSVYHECAWGCTGSFSPARYNSSRAKCIKCAYCSLFFSPNKFIFHSHRLSPHDKYVQPDAANFNSWRRHLKLQGNPPEKIIYAWEDVKAMFNGGTRKRYILSTARKYSSGATAAAVATAPATSSGSSSGSSALSVGTTGTPVPPEKSMPLVPTPTMAADPRQLLPVTPGGIVVGPSTTITSSIVGTVVPKKEFSDITPSVEPNYSSDNSCSSSTSPFAHIPHLLAVSSSSSSASSTVVTSHSTPVQGPLERTLAAGMMSNAAAAAPGSPIVSVVSSPSSSSSSAMVVPTGAQSPSAMAASAVAAAAMVSGHSVVHAGGPGGAPVITSSAAAVAAANFGFKLSCLQPFSFNSIGHFPAMVPSTASYLVPLLRPTNPKSISAAAMSAFKPVCFTIVGSEIRLFALAAQSTTMSSSSSSSHEPLQFINLRLILVSGKTKEFLFNQTDSAGDIALTVFENWPDDWEAEAVAKAEILRLIYQGRFLHCNVTLGALGLPLGKTTVMHLVPRDNLPEPNSQDQRQKSKGGSSRCCSTSCCIL
ncbi:ladybird homeobox corepressor [Anopheles darlingi]|uniref:Ladybird homeobox corepressor n=1 Tax=Anopheles darlingi TaxID=43151 RepID=W5JHG9_ANODA|nr:ladybird homeobox corepressor [Anopheles darlingi]